MRVLVAVLLQKLLVFLFRIKCLHVTSMHWRPIRVQVVYFYAHNSSAWSMNDLLLGVWMIGHYNVRLNFLLHIFNSPYCWRMSLKKGWLRLQKKRLHLHQIVKRLTNLTMLPVFRTRNHIGYIFDGLLDSDPYTVNESSYLTLTLFKYL